MSPGPPKQHFEQQQYQKYSETQIRNRIRDFNVEALSKDGLYFYSTIQYLNPLRIKNVQQQMRQNKNKSIIIQRKQTKIKYLCNNRFVLSVYVKT